MSVDEYKEEYYDNIIAENDKKIKKLKATAQCLYFKASLKT